MLTAEEVRGWRSFLPDDTLVLFWHKADHQIQVVWRSRPPDVVLVYAALRILEQVVQEASPLNQGVLKHTALRWLVTLLEKWRLDAEEGRQRMTGQPDNGETAGDAGMVQ